VTDFSQASSATKSGRLNHRETLRPRSVSIILVPVHRRPAFRAVLSMAKRQLRKKAGVEQHGTPFLQQPAIRCRCVRRKIGHLATVAGLSLSLLLTLWASW
jgi:hypothetical protein